MSALAGEGSLLDVVRDERPWLCQRGIAEYMKRAWNLDDDAVAYWRAYEDFRGFVTEPVWDIVRELAADGAQQQRAAHHAAPLAAHLPEHAAGLERDRRRHATRCPTSSGRRPARRFQAGAEQTHEELEAELGEFCVALTRPPETAFGLLLSGKASLEAAKELVRDFIHLDATRNIAGQLSRQTDAAGVPRHRAGVRDRVGRLSDAQPHGDLGRLREQALGITREELFRWTPPTETIASRYVTKWFLVHCPPEEAIAAFHLGPPPDAREAHRQGALGPRPGRRRRRGAARSRDGATGTRWPSAFERLGIDPDLADYFFRLHREIEPFEQDEGWEYVPEVLRDRPAAPRLQARLHHEDPLRAAEGRGAAAAE